MNNAKRDYDYHEKKGIWKMKKIKHMLLSIMLVIVMLVCSACMNAGAKVTVKEDGTSSYHMEILLGKEEYESLTPMIKKMMEKTLGSDAASAYMPQIDQIITGLEVVNENGKEYYRQVADGDMQQVISYLEQQGAGSVSVGKDYFYACAGIGASESTEGGTDTAIQQLLELKDQMGLTEEDLFRLMVMIQDIKVNLTVEFPNPVTYSNGAFEAGSNQVTWNLSGSDAKNTASNHAGNVLYAETMNPSKLLNDKTAPSIKNIKNKGYYKKSTIAISDATGIAGAKLEDGSYVPVTQKKVTLNGVVSEGKHTITVYDYAGNQSKITFTYDKTAPTIKGVKNGKTYKKAVTVSFSDKYGVKSAKLNGKTIKNKKKVTKKGSYTLKVTDKAGNTKTVKFKVKK